MPPRTRQISETVRALRRRKDLVASTGSLTVGDRQTLGDAVDVVEVPAQEPDVRPVHRLGSALPPSPLRDEIATFRAQLQTIQLDNTRLQDQVQTKEKKITTTKTQQKWLKSRTQILEQLQAC
ncbi:hypothetical protein HK097_010547 [Rhizophlyctis rosea]|uniref:Uncharacterized protein n=1 Tax=Rhizophlyctis rosea TaxID=64517 RepID=A0AAD5X3P0_9FUNG|nr:hypothetical protein HK097_010547 [Rhizophlyctis rosea]